MSVPWFNRYLLSVGIIGRTMRRILSLKCLCGKKRRWVMAFYLGVGFITFFTVGVVVLGGVLSERQKKQERH